MADTPDALAGALDQARGRAHDVRDSIVAGDDEKALVAVERLLDALTNLRRRFMDARSDDHR